MLQKGYAGSGNEAIRTLMDFYRLQHKKAQIFVTSNAVIKICFILQLMIIILYVSSAYDDDDDDVNCERRYWKVEVVLAINEQTKSFKCTWESIPTFAMNGSNALSS